MTEPIRDHDDGVWCRLRCQVCASWLAIPAAFDTDDDRPPERLRRRLDRRVTAFTHRHRHPADRQDPDTPATGRDEPGRIQR